LKRISPYSQEELKKQEYFWEKPNKKISRIVRIWEKYFAISEDKIFEIWWDFWKVIDYKL